VSGVIPPLPNTPPWRGAQLKKHRTIYNKTVSHIDHFQHRTDDFIIQEYLNRVSLSPTCGDSVNLLGKQRKYMKYYVLFPYKPVKTMMWK
jgi:hypothetical protein